MSFRNNQCDLHVKYSGMSWKYHASGALPDHGKVANIQIKII